MASESSSAVLDLNDADVTEDTDAPSVTEDAVEGIPLIMEHGYDIAVKVDTPIKQLSTLETFVTYRVRCVCARWSSPPCVRRRYNHFRVLHKRLAAEHPLLAAPPLPPHHSARQQLDRYSPSFVAIRTLALNAFLTRVAKHPILTHSEHLRAFLIAPDEEIDKFFKSENSALNLWGLSAPRAGGESKPVNGARVKDPEFTSAADYLSSLQHKLTALCALTVKLHKGSAAVGGELMGMKRACDAWATQSRGAPRAGAGACGAGAGRAAGARGAGAGAAGGGAGARARATLPLLAAYCQAHNEKIRQRDALHATYVSGSNTTGELHNRLEQASEALRSELTDWIPKTRSEIKSILLDMATWQVNTHTQTLAGWEHALKLSKETNVAELFKTVSATAVQNLSPSRAAPPLVRAGSDSTDLSKVDIDFMKADDDFSKVDEDYTKVDDDFSKVDDDYSKVNDDYSKADDDYLKAGDDYSKADDDYSNADENSPKVENHRTDGEVRSDPLKDFADVNLSS